jgi:hypothetical protein
MTDKQETSTPDEGPASLREALLESFDELSGDTPTEPETTDSGPIEDEPTPAASLGEEAVESQGDEPSDEETVIQAPEHWSDEDRTMFGTLSGDAQNYLLKREKQYEKGIQEKAEKLAEIDKVFEPYDPYLAMRGIDRKTAMQNWIAAQQALDLDPVNALKQIIRGYGPEVEQQFSPEKSGLSEYGDPELDSAKLDVERERKSLEEENRRLNFQRQQQAAVEIQRFKDEQDEQGNLKHPFFEQASMPMRALLANGQAVDLADAYEKAVWMLPEFRELQQETQQQQLKQQEAKKREDAAKQAKKVAKTVEGRGSKPPPPSKQRTMRDDLLQAYDDSLRGEL